MDVVQLRTLREVVERGSVTAAAAALHLTPSAVSQQVKSLERAVGTALLERVGRGVRPTPAGRVLADGAVEVAVAVQRAAAALDGFRHGSAGTVRVAAFSSGAQMLFPALLRWAAEQPGLVMECRDEDVAQDDFVRLTADYDVVVAHRPDRVSTWGRGVLVEPLLREPLDVAVPVDHWLAGRATVQPADLVDERWIAVREGFPVAAVLDAVAAAAGHAPRIAQRINDFHVVEALVSTGAGVSLLPRFTADHRDGTRFRLLPLTGVRAGRQVDALARPERAERTVVRRVLDRLHAVAAEIVDGAPHR